MTGQDRSTQARPDQDRPGQARTGKKTSKDLKRYFVRLYFNLCDFVHLTQLCTNFVLVGFKAILGHEGGTRKFRAMAQNKAIYISFQMI